MENKSKYLLYVIIPISILILIASVYKAEENNKEKLLLVVDNKIKESAKDCYIDKKCEGKITLKELYEKKNLTKIVNPITKEVINEDTCLEYQDEKVIFCK